MRSFFNQHESLPFLDRLISPAKPSLWSSRRYFSKQLLRSEEDSPNERTIVKNQLQADLRSFFDEYAALKAQVIYQYGSCGIRHGYTESMSQIATNFYQALAEQNRPTARAELEVAVAETIEQWMTDTSVTTRDAVGEKMVTISPRGLEMEGYPGLDQKNYVFVNIYEKTNDGFLLWQFRNYEKNQDLPKLQDALLKIESSVRLSALERANFQLSPETITAGHLSSRVDLRTIDTIIQLPAAVQIQQLLTVLFANQMNWPINIHRDLPELNADQYQHQLARIVEFCLHQFDNLLNLACNDASQQFDVLIDLSRQAFLKWVEDHAENYNHNQKFNYDLDLNQLNLVWQVQIQTKAGQHLPDKSWSSLIKSFSEDTKLNPSLPLNQAASWAHCIAGTPMSTFNNPSLMQAMHMNQLSINQLAEVIGAERAKLWHIGVCRQCGQTTMVGECSICLSCELKLGNQTTEDVFANLQSEITADLSLKEKQKADQLFNILAGIFLRSSINPGQWLLGDVLDPNAAVDDWREIADRVKSSLNPLKELEHVVFELTQDVEGKSNSKKQSIFTRNHQIDENADQIAAS